jgi:hypothetical protein
LGLAGAPPPLGILHPTSGEPLVEWRSSSLSQKQEALTTLNVVYQSVETILAANRLTNFGEKDRVTRPNNSQLEQAYRWCTDWWTSVLANIDAYRRAVEKPYLIPDLRSSRSPSALLFRPVVQVALFAGLAEAVRLGLVLGEATKRVCALDWRADADHWRDVIVRANGAPIAKSEAINLTGRIIGDLLAGDRPDPARSDRLRLAVAEAKGWDPHSTMPMPSLPVSPFAP